MIGTHSLAGLAGAAIAATIAWQVQGMRCDGQIAPLRAEHAQTLQRIAEKTTAAYDLAQRREQEITAALAAADQQYTQELHDAKTETDRLRACVRAGTCGVRIVAQPARCDGGHASAEDSATGSMGDAAGALDAGVSERVLDLRDAISADAAALRYLQDYARQCSAPR